MSLSNTATPKYYWEFRESVLRGDIPVNWEVSQQMNRIDSLIKDPNMYYDDEAVEGFIKYCENELTLTDGSDVKLLPTFKLWAEDVFGWYYFITKTVYEPYQNHRGGRYVRKRYKRRLINKQYLIVGRGAAKTLYEAYIQAYFLNVDTSTTDQITTAPTMDQADEVLSPIRTAITRSRGPLFSFLTEGSIHNTSGSKAGKTKLASTKKGIENFLTSSIIRVRPMSIPKLQGLRTKINTIDEWLSCDIREDPVGAIEQGAAKIPDWLIIAVSSEGTFRNGAGDQIKMELMKILKGEYKNPHVSIWWYKLDDIKEVGDPSMWLKANPNLGYTVSYETYQEEVERMEHNPSLRNDTLAKRFGLPMEGFTYFFTYEETERYDKKKLVFWGLPCSLGMDASQGDDFWAFTFLFPLQDGRFGIKTRSYISELTMRKLSPALRPKYEEFIEEGSLMVMPGNVLEWDIIYDDLDQYITDNEYDVFSFGFDPYNAEAFITRWERENGSHGIEKVIQGSKTESVPLGEIKKLAGEKMLLFDESLMSFTMGNCITIEDTNGNRKLLKLRYEDKIDNVSALMDAFVAYKRHKEDFE